MINRCAWVPRGNELYTKYHDEEWGVPVHEDKRHFEFLILEGAQAGLSWETILKRREGYRAAFADFEAERVAEFGEKEIEKLLKNPGIIRNRLKVRGAVNTARQFLKVQAEFGSFDDYVWQFVGGKPIQHEFRKLSDCPAFTQEAEQLSRDLKRRGFTFVGPTIMFAHMQACGLVNDHLVDCFRYDVVKRLGN